MGTIQTRDLSLILLISLSVLSSLVMELLISDLPHLLWIAVLDIESILGFEEHVSGELFRSLTLILFFEIHEGLLSVWNNLYFGYLTLASCGEVNF